MALGPRLEFRQSQQLVMTPQLQQAIKLLQLSNLDLAEYVEQEMERNPLLEPGTDEAPAASEPPTDAPADPAAETLGDDTSATDGDGPVADEPPTQELALSDDGAPPTTESDLDTDLSNVYADESAADAAADKPADTAPGPTDSNWQSTRAGGAGGDGDFGIDMAASREPTLAEHLAEQLHMAIADPQQRLIGAHLIDQVNEAGYLTEDVATIATRIGASEADVEAVLKVMHGFDPAGICARDLRECLAIQLREKNRLDPAMALFLDHLDLFAKRDMTKLMKVLDADAEDIQSMVEDIRTCNPKPGLAFGSEPVQPVVPDVFVRENPEGGWSVELNSETLPRVLVNATYYAEVSRHAKDAEAKSYLSECFNNANWLVKSLDQRARTILKVSGEIVRQQDAFLAHGVHHLKPLNLKTVAEAISMHESTVSRVTANKYIATTRGIFELKYFFTAAIASTEGGDAYSAEAVRQRIRELIDNERADAVLSDDNLVDLLRGMGIDIARRTVAKYREALHIPSSVQRRREKKAYA